MSNHPAKQPDYLSDHAVRRQIGADIKSFSLTQVSPSLILAMGAFFYAWWTGQVTSFSYGVLFVVYSVAAGLALYVLIAVIRAPFIVFGWHLRQISSLSVRLADRLPELRVNAFSDFRVISEGPSGLEFEVWYFYDGALGDDGICISVSAANNGVPVRGIDDPYESLDIVRHKALVKMHLGCRSIEGQASVKSTHIVLAMVRDTTDSIFYRQLIPYEKTWDTTPKSAK